ncbi:hypothetical protein PBI_DEWDROP_15 [Microbacterium phage Dewdrop]|nr:hypothetical protein PBI_LEAF_15 [Microbacterium phage Leaf]QGZ17384.1 hypothetical protein PBI_DEWDROP_15 [Microbacterium phage Dewdrop]
MGMPDFNTPIDPTSKAWCGDCDFKAWGVWSHKKAHEHFLEYQATGADHIVYVKEPDTPEQIAEREAKIAQLEAEEAEALEQRGELPVSALQEAIDEARRRR